MGGSGTPRLGERALGLDPPAASPSANPVPPAQGLPWGGGPTGNGGFEPCGQLPGHDLVGMTEPWRDGCRGRGTQEGAKAEALPAAFASVSAGPPGLQGSRLTEAGERLEQGSRTLGGRGSGQGILQETGRSQVFGELGGTGDCLGGNGRLWGCWE